MSYGRQCPGNVQPSSKALVADLYSESSEASEGSSRRIPPAAACYKLRLRSPSTTTITTSACPSGQSSTSVGAKSS